MVVVRMEIQGKLNGKLEEFWGGIPFFLPPTERGQIVFERGSGKRVGVLWERVVKTNIEVEE